MALPASDDFNRAGPGLGANWTQMTQFWGDLQIESSSQCTATVSEDTSLDGQARWDADTFPDNQYAQCSIANFGDVFNTRVGVIARSSGNNNSGSESRSFYAVYARDTGGTNNYLIAKVVSGTITNLHTSSRTIAEGDTLRIEVEGTDIRGYHNGALVTTVSDSAISSGQAGALCGAGVALDNWTAGEIVPPGIPVAWLTA